MDNDLNHELTCGIGICRIKFQDERSLLRHYETVHHFNLTHLKISSPTNPLPFPLTGHHQHNSNQNSSLSSSSGKVIIRNDLPTSNNVPISDTNKTKIRKYPCGYPGCQWVFTRTNHVVRHHERVHPGFKPVKASVSTTTTTTTTTTTALNNNSESDKSLESRRKSSATVLACSQAGCDQIFNDPLLLKNHIKLFHGSEKLLPTLLDQSTHNSLHLGTSNGFKLREALTGHHVCDFNGCGQRFSSKNELNYHLFQVHSLVEPEVCIKVEGQEWGDDDESKTFQGGQLEEHISCDYLGCDKVFTKISHLLLHKEECHNLNRTSQSIKMPRSPRPYACSLPGCDKTYTKNSHLVRHLVETHKLAKPSPKVNRRFGPSSYSPQSQSNTVSSSIGSIPSSTTRGNTNTNHNNNSENSSTYNERPYACNFPGCGWSFKRQYHLNRHIITHKMYVTDQIHKQQNQHQQHQQQHHHHQRHNQSQPQSHNRSRGHQPGSTWIDLDNEHEDDSGIDFKNVSDPAEDDPFTCDYPGCGKVFIDSQKFVNHYLQHSGPSRVSSSSSYLWKLAPPSIQTGPMGCILQEIPDDSEAISLTSNCRIRGNGTDSFSKKVIIEVDDS